MRHIKMIQEPTKDYENAGQVSKPETKTKETQYEFYKEDFEQQRAQSEEKLKQVESQNKPGTKPQEKQHEFY